MPSIRVSGSKVLLAVFDVVGQDGKEVGFIDHTGLAKLPGDHDTGSVPVLDMGPPLRGHDHPGSVRASVVGSASLTDDETQKIRTFIDRHSNEHLVFQQFEGRKLLRAAPQMFCILPHSSPLCEDDGRYARTRFSCAGFVLDAYRKARIALLNVESLPMVDLTVIKSAYPRYFRFMENGTIDPEELGIEGNGPWPVLLCGYLFHALNRDADAIRKGPHTPDVAHRFFA